MVTQSGFDKIVEFKANTGGGETRHKIDLQCKNMLVLLWVVVYQSLTIVSDISNDTDMLFVFAFRFLPETFPLEQM